MFKTIYRLAIVGIISFSLTGCSTKPNAKDEYHGKSAQDIYAIAKQHVDDGRYALAIKDFEALEARFPYGKYSDKAQLGLAFSYFKKGEYPFALVEVDRFMRLYPKHKDSDYAYYLKGLINYEANFSMAFKYLPLDRSKREPIRARQSFDDFKYLLKKYPNSKYAHDAKKRMILLKDQLAEHELHIAEHYYEKGSYLAAANRANNIVNKFDKTKAVPKALVMMIKSYNKLGMDELARDAQSILNKNYPKVETKESS